MERAEVEHAELVRLCKSGKVSEACSLLKMHIEGVGKSLRNYFEEHNKTT
jgi:DNA-binding GntR family transcriptional regulator